MCDLTWDDVLNLPCYILNMDRAQDRMLVALNRIKKAGFTNVQRYRAVDGKNDNIEEEWKKYGSPRFASRDWDFCNNKGKQACAMGHYGIWFDIVQNKHAYAVIFEDDVQFHKYWDILAPEYWNITPRNFDIMYIGSQIESDIPGLVISTPLYCTHAYIISLQGASKLFKLCLSWYEGVYTIDCMLFDRMKEILDNNKLWFTWYAWRASEFYDDNAHKKESWAKRNVGLVFQDPDMGSDIAPEA